MCRSKPDPTRRPGPSGSGATPYWMSVMALNSFCDISPGAPSPTLKRWSFQPSSPTGEITAAVPVPNTSLRRPERWALSSSSTVMRRSLTVWPHRRKSAMVLSRVTPDRIVPDSDGVANSSPMCTNRFMVPTSSRAACSSASVHSTCENPAALASSAASKLAT